MDKKRLLIVASTFPKGRDDSVTARFVFDLASALSRFYSVYILAPHSAGLPSFEEIDGLKIHRFKYFIPSSLQKLSSGQGMFSDLKGSILAVLQIPLFLISQLLNIIVIAISNKIDIINSHWIIPQGFLCAMAKTFLRCRHILTIHAADIFALKRYGIVGSHICRFVLNRTDATLPVSRYIKEQVETVGRKKISGQIIPMGADASLFKPGAERYGMREDFNLKEVFTFLFVGKFTEKKGIEFLLNAAILLKERGLEYNLLLAGGGPLYSSLTELADRKGLKPEVRFLGSMRNDYLPGVYALSDVLVVPSVFDSKGETEGMPVVIQEAMACGVPVLASYISGIPDIVKDGENGWLCEPADAVSLADKMQEVMMLGDLESYRKNALRTAEENSCAKIASRYYDAIEESKNQTKAYELGLSIHNKINIHISSTHEFYIDHFKKEYPDIFYKDKYPRTYDILFFIDRELPAPKNNDICIKEIFKGLHPYACLIRNIEKTPTEVYFKTSFNAKFLYPSMAAVFLQAEILEPLIYLKALNKGLLMLHASGVFNGSGGYIFAASTGVGKTTIAFHLLSKGFGFLGDDLVFISGGGEIYSYPKRVHFFSYLKEKNPFLSISRKALAVSRIRLVLRNLLRFITKKEFYLSTRMDIRDIMPGVDIGEAVMARRLFMLDSKLGVSGQNGPGRKPYSRIIETCDTRKSLFNNILKDKQNLLEDVFKKEDDIMSTIIKNFKFEEIFIDDVIKDSGNIAELLKR